MTYMQSIGRLDPSGADEGDWIVSSVLARIEDLFPHSQTPEEFSDKLTIAESRMADLREWLENYWAPTGMRNHRSDDYRPED